MPASFSDRMGSSLPRAVAAAGRVPPTLGRAFAMLALAALLLAVLAVPPGRPALAQSEADLFVATGVPVDESGKSAVEAREKAIAAGQVKALQIVMERLVSPDLVGQLPAVPASQVPPMVQSIEIDNERTAGARYRGDLTVRFFPEAVRDVMAGANIPFAAKPAPPALVLPVYSTATADNLWEEPNPWRDSWSTYGRASPMVPLLVPFGELSDVQAISAREALDGAAEPLDRIARRYDVQDVVLVHASAQPDGRMDVEVSRYWSGGTMTPVDRFTANGDQDGMRAAVDRVIGNMATTVRTGEAVRPRMAAAPTGYGRAGAVPGALSLSALVGYADLAQWVQISQVLAKVDLVQGLQIDTIAASGAQVVLNHRGTTDQLRERLRSANLLLRNDGPYWALTVMDPTRAVTVPAAMPAGALDDPAAGTPPPAMQPRQPSANPAPPSSR